MRKILLLVSITALVIGCKKTPDNNPISNSGNVTFNMNGTNYSNSTNNWAQFIYLDSNLSSIQFGFQKIDLAVGSPFNSPSYSFKNYYGTDSFLTNTPYQAVIPTEIHVGSTINAIDANYCNIKITITNYANNKISGTFYGAIKGLNSLTKESASNTITNGTFTDIPVSRLY